VISSARVSVPVRVDGVRWCSCKGCGGLLFLLAAAIVPVPVVPGHVIWTTTDLAPRTVTHVTISSVVGAAARATTNAATRATTRVDIVTVTVTTTGGIVDPQSMTWSTIAVDEAHLEVEQIDRLH
jgi:hypothetical protein